MAKVKEIVKESRTGKRALPVPEGVQVSLSGQTVKVKGPKGELERKVPAEVEIKQEGGQIRVQPREGTGKQGVQYQGLARALVRNMVEGVSEGYKLSLDFRGVGYRANVKEGQLEMVVGLSHGVTLPIPEDISVQVETIDSGGTKFPRLHLESARKEILGQFAARVRGVRPPEPYKGKGVRYTGEHVAEKSGKAGKAAAK